MLRPHTLLLPALLLSGLLALPASALADDTEDADTCRCGVRCHPQEPATPQGTITPSQPTVLEGELEQQDIDIAVRGQIRPLLQHCYAPILADAPHTSGTLKFHITLRRELDDGGRLVSLAVQQSSIPDNLESCVRRQFLSRDFRRPTLESDLAKVEIELTFKPPGEDKEEAAQTPEDDQNQEDQDDAE